jgi:hypothetical protein
MKLQRYFKPEKESWTWIGFETLLPVIGVKALGEFMDLDNASIGATASVISYFSFLYKLIQSREEFDFILHNTPVKNEETVNICSELTLTYVKVKADPQFLMQGVNFLGACALFLLDVGNAKNYSYNIGLKYGLLNACTSAMANLFSFVLLAVHYIPNSEFVFDKNLNYVGRFESHIEWVGKADEDGYCECVIVDEQGNVYNDFEIAL